ncbi:MAG: winged helix-turn-helix transcriptional regulator [Gammaproteobacteria bacterium]|nr:winged helix-turn-helix transcriptional regulator [Gammaproteobacteria bacterium]
MTNTPSPHAVAAQLLRTIAHPLRLAILCHLQQQPRNVGELISLTGANQSNLSQHLAKLRLSSIIGCVRRQQHVYYHIQQAEIGQLIDLLYTLYCDDADVKERLP